MLGRIEEGELVAVYGSLRSGLGNHRLLTSAPRQDDGIIPDGEFYMVSLGGFPGLIPPHEPLYKSTPIVVEVYEVDSNQRAISLDGLEGYPSFYDRKQVVLEDGRCCWVYFLDDSYSKHPWVSNGDWKDFLQSNK